MISTYSFQLRKYQRLLVKKETAYARCLASLAALSKITFDSEGTRRQYEEHMLGSWIYTQKIKLNKEGMIQILQLKMKIAGIESELTALRSM